jgi:hypothetical protein
MKIYEAVLKGYNGGSDETDHLIKWIKAPSLELAEKAIKEQGWETNEPVLELLAQVDDEAIDLFV